MGQEPITGSPKFPNGQIFLDLSAFFGQITNGEGSFSGPATLRLTIVIPLLPETSTEAFEETLASVLVHKPDGAEVLIANGTNYSDPWETATEGVGYIALAHLSNPVDVLNGAIRQSQGEILHILSPGTEVSADWTANTLKFFEKQDLGIVIPSVYDRRKPKRIFALGIWYKPEGVLRTVRRSQWAEAADKVIVPHISSVFIRKNALLQVHGFETDFIPQLSYVNAAMAMTERGWQTVIDPSCRMTVRPNCLPAMDSFTWGLQVEHLYFRWLSGHATLWTLGKHFGSFGVDFWRNLPRFKAFQILAGRLFGLTFCGEGLSLFRRSHQEPLPLEIEQPDILTGFHFGEPRDDSATVKRIA